MNKFRICHAMFGNNRTKCERVSSRTPDVPAWLLLTKKAQLIPNVGKLSARKIVPVPPEFFLIFLLLNCCVFFLLLFLLNVLLIFLHPVLIIVFYHLFYVSLNIFSLFSFVFWMSSLFLLLFFVIVFFLSLLFILMIFVLFVRIVFPFCFCFLLFLNIFEQFFFISGFSVFLLQLLVLLNSCVPPVLLFDVAFVGTQATLPNDFCKKILIWGALGVSAQREFQNPKHSKNTCFLQTWREKIQRIWPQPKLYKRTPPFLKPWWAQILHTGFFRHFGFFRRTTKTWGLSWFQALLKEASLRQPS